MKIINIKKILSVFIIFCITLSFSICSGLNSDIHTDHHDHEKNSSHFSHFQSLTLATFTNFILSIVNLLFFIIIINIFLLNILTINHVKNFSPPNRLKKIYLSLNKSRAPPVCFNF